jgi:hypothetical protein
MQVTSTKRSIRASSAGALLELFGVPWPLAPILIAACGLALLWAALRSKDPMKK